MRNLLDFLYRFRTFWLFVLLEVFCAWLIIRYNHRYNASFLNSSNVLAANISQFGETTSDYFNLEEVNEQLLKENRQLRDMLLRRSSSQISSDHSSDRYKIVSAHVINNTFDRSMNFLTLNVGSEKGVEPGMGVLSGTGIIGQVKSVSRNFSSVYSLLNRSLMVSSVIARTNTICTVQWNGESPIQAEVNYIPRHIKLQVGDTVLTSDYNAVFPRGILIGTIAELTVRPEDVYYEATIDLSTDFTSLDYAYVVIDELKAEKDSLEAENIIP